MDMPFKFQIEDIKAMVDRGITFNSLYLSKPKGGPTTLRQMPQNYLVAQVTHGRWICEPDLAADQFLCIMVFNLFLLHPYKYDTTGCKLMTYFEIILKCVED